MKSRAQLMGKTTHNRNRKYKLKQKLSQKRLYNQVTKIACLRPSKDLHFYFQGKMNKMIQYKKQIDTTETRSIESNTKPVNTRVRRESLSVLKG